MATPSSVRVWKSQRTEEPGGLRSTARTGSDAMERRSASRPPGITYSKVLSREHPRRTSCVRVRACVCVRACACVRSRAKSLQSRPTLCDPMDGVPPGSSVFEILQARIRERAVISFSRDLVCIILIIQVSKC